MLHHEKPIIFVKLTPKICSNILSCYSKFNIHNIVPQKNTTASTVQRPKAEWSPLSNAAFIRRFSGDQQSQAI